MKLWVVNESKSFVMFNRFSILFIVLSVPHQKHKVVRWADEKRTRPVPCGLFTFTQFGKLKEILYLHYINNL